MLCHAALASEAQAGRLRPSASPMNQRGPVHPARLVPGATRRLVEKRVAFPVLTHRLTVRPGNEWSPASFPGVRKQSLLSDRSPLLRTAGVLSYRKHF